MYDTGSMSSLNQPSEKFLAGFNHELNNRAFSKRVVEHIKDRLTDDHRLVFCECYYELELHNERRYRDAARQWGLDFTPGWWTKLRAWVVGSTPKILLDRLIGRIYLRTIDYLVILRHLKSIGPEAADSFLEYMVAQEVLQIEMMRFALENRYEEIPRLLSVFLWKYRS